MQKTDIRRILMSDLYQLPDGWEWNKLSDVTSLVGGGTPSRNVIEYWENGHIVWLSPTDLENIGEVSSISNSKDKITQLGLEKSSAKLLPIGTVLFSSRATIGKIAINTVELTTNQGFTNFICKESLNNQYLAYCLVNFTKGITTLSNSTTFKEVSKSALKEFKIPVPPLAEQKRIVQKIDALFDRIDKAIALLQKNINAADNFMNSVLNDVFSDLEQTYSSESLENASNIISGYAFKSNDFSPANEVKSIKITNVGVRVFIEDNENKLPFGLLSKLSKFTVNENDIVIALTRPYISNGLKVCFVPNSYDGAFINQRVAAIKSKYEVTNNKYVYYYLCTSKVLNNVIELSKTLNQPNLSIKDLAGFELPIAPLSVQQDVISYLDDLNIQIERAKSSQQQKKQNLLDLKSSILDQAFHGKL